MNDFYAAFSPACFALLGLWLVIVQTRLPQWQAGADYAVYRRGSYGVALHFALPGMMSVLALVDPADSAYWRTSFAIVALGGAATLIATRSLADRREPNETRQAGDARHARQTSASHSSVGGGLGLFAYVAAIVLYCAIGALAFIGGLTVLRLEGILLTALVFLGFNAAWLLLEETPGASGPGTVSAAAGSQAEPGPAADGNGNGDARTVGRVRLG
jgi:hypothetical protein